MATAWDTRAGQRMCVWGEVQVGGLDIGKREQRAGAAGRPPATRRGYLGTSNAICAREATAARSTLREEGRSVGSGLGCPLGWHWADTGDRERGSYTLARGAGQASRSGFASGSSLSFLSSRARGSLNTSGALETAERRGQPVVRGPPGARSPAG